MSDADRGGDPTEARTEEWLFETGDRVTSSPTVVDGTVYVGSWDYNLYAVEVGGGREEWAFETGGVVRSSPTVVDGTVYVGSADGLYAVGASSGEQEWGVETGDILGPSLTVADGTVYVGSGGGSLYAVDATSGEKEWLFETGDRVTSSPTVVDGTVYVGSRDRSLYAVDAASGTEEWAFETRGADVSSPAVADETVYIGSGGGTLYAVDAASGEANWAFETGGFVFSSPIVADGTVYVGSGDCNLYAVDATSGEEQWRFDTGGDIVSSPTVADGTVYVGSDDENLYAVDAASGEANWTFATRDYRGHVRSSPTVVDGTVYVGSDDGNLYAVGAASGEEPRSSELAGGSRAHDRASARLPVVQAPTEQVPAADAATSPPHRPDLSPDALGVVEEIGAGGQAIITEARLPEAQQPPATVALRQPDTSATLTREAVKEFISQAELWATIDAREREKQRWADSEHIVGVVAVGDRQPWLAMEYMDGGDLEELLAEHPDGLPVGQALWTGECVCKGLEVAHNLGKVHLDVKPGNVLLKETDGWPWPKLADWGLARTLAHETGTMEGLSVAYAGPEQFDSETFGDPDQLTDIYQTGALVYALLTGEPPATGGQLEVMKTVIGEEPIAPPSDRRAKLPAAVDAAVGLALEREKTDRYSSVSVFGDALHALRTGGRLPRDVAARLDE